MRLVNLSKEYLNLPEVTKSLTINPKTGRGIKGGLYDTDIFGEPRSKPYKNQFAYIDLNTVVISPVILNMLKISNRKVYKIVLNNLKFSIDEEDNIDIDPNGKYIGVFHIIRFMKEGRVKISNSESIFKKALVKLIEKDDAIFMTRVIVPPPYYRPVNYADGVYSPDEVNNIYMDILKFSHQIKSVRITDKNVNQYSLLLSYIQTKTFEIFKYIKDKVGGKYGMIRQNIISKTTDFSGRAVITGNPDIPVDKVLLPFVMAVQMFKPFVLHHMYNDMETIEKYLQRVYNSEQNGKILAENLIDDISTFKIKNENVNNMMRKYVDKAIKDKLVLMKRDPSLHRDSWRSFYVGITMDNTIHISHMVCGGFNADFDGDQMAVFLPLTNEAQEEAKKLLYTRRIYKASKYKSIMFGFSKENALGLYMLTHDPNKVK